MADNFKNYMAEQTRERNETALESTLSRGHRMENMVFVLFFVIFYFFLIFINKH